MPGGLWLGGTDGSGGAHSADPQVRRVGWSFVVSDAALLPAAWARGALAGEQTVPHSELEALRRLAECTRGSRGDLHVYVDNLGVVQGFRKGPQATHKKRRHLWRQLWEAVADRDGKVTVEKVRSHRTADDIDSGSISIEAYVLDSCADTLADAAAAESQLPWHTHQHVNWLRAEVWSVQRHTPELAWPELRSGNSPPANGPIAKR